MTQEKAVRECSKRTNKCGVSMCDINDSAQLRATLKVDTDHSVCPFKEKKTLRRIYPSRSAKYIVFWTTDELNSTKYNFWTWTTKM